VVHLNWDTVLQSVVASSLSSWPVFAAGLWVQHRRVRTDLHKVTHAQTAYLQNRLDEQTRQITGRAEPGNPPERTPS
jgi:hypothetical protein